MRFREVFRYELTYRLRSAPAWIYAVVLLLVAMWMFLGTADGPPGDFINSPERLAGGMVVVGMFGMLITAALFGDAAVRDVEAGMDPLLFTSRLRPAEYLGGRFLANLLVNAVLLLAIPIGFIIATRLAGSFETTGPFRIAAYLQAYFIIALPNAVIAGALLFAIAARVRQVVPVYLGTIGLFIGYVVALNYMGRIESPALAMLIDPFGAGTIEALTVYWTQAERNTRLIGFAPQLLLNRLLWLTIALGVLGHLARAFRFTHGDGRVSRRERRRVLADPSPNRSISVAVPRVAGTFTVGASVRQVLAIAQHSLAEAVAGRWFVVVLLACTGMALLFGWNVGSTVFDTSTWPVTLLVIGEVLSARIGPIPWLLIALYAGELVWRDRTLGTAEIADASPLPQAAPLLGRFLALMAMIALIEAAFMLGGILIQLLQGYTHLELGLYLRTVFGLNFTYLVLLAALAMTIHVIVNHRYLGHIVVLLTIIFTFAAPRMGIVRHHLLLYGTDPGWTYSDMNGFGPFIAPLAWFRLYWYAWALLLGTVAVLFWVRGREEGMRRRILAARVRLTVPVVRALAVAVALVLGLGGFIYYNTNVLNEYRTRAEQSGPRARYEQRYAKYAALPQPTIVAAGLRVEIRPEQPAVEIRGTYRLVNRTPAAIDSVHLYTREGVQVRDVSFDGGAQQVLADEETGYRIYALDRALQPGEATVLHFSVSFRPRGFTNEPSQTDVVANGSNFNRGWLPFVGYQPMFELTSDEARRQYGLPPRAPAPTPDRPGDRSLRQPWRDADNVMVDAVIGTAADQTAITMGTLRDSWEANGRSYFRYVTEAPTAFGVTVFSGKYAVRRDRWNDVALSIFHHPAHADATEPMLRGMKAALEVFTAEFGPYPDSQLRIVEIPRYGGFGIAHPHTIGFTEDAFFSRVRDGEVDQPFYGTAHEVAHQWWGGMARGANGVRGGGFLSESLANYSAMMLMEKTFGEAMGRKVYDFQMERYLRGRSSQAREVPALQVEDQPYIAYRKGALALWTLREHIGEQRVNAALRRYLDRQRAGVAPFPTSLDLYAELRAVTPDSLHYLLTDWFETVTLWRVEAKQAVVERAADGRYVVALDVVAKKVRADSAGTTTEVPMDEPVEIGVYGQGGTSSEPLYLQRHRIRSGKQTIRITVASEPLSAGIDPRRRLIDTAREDNVVEVSRKR